MSRCSHEEHAQENTLNYSGELTEKYIAQTLVAPPSRLLKPQHGILHPTWRVIVSFVPNLCFSNQSRSLNTPKTVRPIFLVLKANAATAWPVWKLLMMIAISAAKSSAGRAEDQVAETGQAAGYVGCCGHFPPSQCRTPLKKNAVKKFSPGNRGNERTHHLVY